MVTKDDADRILAEEKVIEENLQWQFDGRGYRLDARVFANRAGEVLRLLGYVGRKNRSFALLYRDTPIRKYTVHDRHRDPATGEVFRGPHKHWWDDVWEDRRVYIPDDIRTGDPNEELVDFLGECNIQLMGIYRFQTFS